MTPLAIDLYCGLGGWTEGLLAEGYEVIGFDIERHRYPAREIPDSGGTKVKSAGVDFNSRSSESKHRSFNYANEVAMRKAPLTGGWIEYPAQLVLQDVLTLHGSQFRDASLIVASPPCQEFSYMAMPWSRAKQIAREYQEGVRDRAKLTALFDACFRIQREAIEAAGHHIPLVVENVRGAIPWVGRSRWNYGSFHLFGDVPALMPMTAKRHATDGSMKCPSESWNPSRPSYTSDKGWKNIAHNTTSGCGQNPDGRKVVDHLNKRNGHRSTSHLTNPAEHIADENGRKVTGDWFGSYADMKAKGTISPGPMHGKGSTARKAASALIAKIPLPLSMYIARTFKPEESHG